jgi:hypothetical protein
MLVVVNGQRSDESLEDISSYLRLLLLLLVVLCWCLEEEGKVEAEGEE